MIFRKTAARLQPAEYGPAFGAFRGSMRRDQYTVITDWFGTRFIPRLIGNRNEMDVHYLGVGAGNGMLDRQLLRALVTDCRIKLRSVTLIEPNERLFADLSVLVDEMRGEFPNVDFLIHKTRLEEFKPDRCYEVVVGIQVFYYFANRLTALATLLELTTEQLVIAHEMPVGKNAINRELCKRLGGPTEWMFHMGELIDLLEHATLHHVLEVLWAELDVSKCLDSKDELGSWLLSFLLQVNMRRLYPWQRWMARRSLLRHSFQDAQKRRIFPQPVGILMIPAGQSHAPR